MKTLIAKLTEADIAYYKNDAPIMTDRDYDLLYDELTQLESSTGVILAGSPTQKVSGEILEELTEVRHTRPMLSRQGRSRRMKRSFSSWMAALWS